VSDPRTCTRRMYSTSPMCGRPALVIDPNGPSGLCARHGGRTIADVHARNPRATDWVVVKASPMA
jgi:hypothetical protein